MGGGVEPADTIERMQRTPRSASTRAEEKQAISPRRKLANAAIIGMSALIFLGAGTAALQDQQVESQNREAANSYTPAVAPVAQEDAPDRPTALFIGDSYTAGAGSSSQGYRWTSQAAQDLGWREVNIGFGGTGYVKFVEAPDSQNACKRSYCPTYAEALEDYDQANPETVVIAGGRNDRGVASEALKEAVDGLLTDVNERFPEAKVYVVNPVWDDDPAPSEFEEVISVVTGAVDPSEAQLVDIGQPLNDQPSMLASDGAHPNNKGHAALAEAFAEAIQ